MSISRSFLVYSTSLLALPIAYIVNTAQTLNGEIGLFISGTVAMLIIGFLTYLAIHFSKEPVDPMMYVIAIGMFSSVVDIAIGLENDGIITGIIGEYLLNGEPYLKTPHGTFICYWDGTGHYAMYVAMLYQMAFKKDYTVIGLYWSGSIIHSIIVFITGNFVGDHTIHWSILLNIPFIIVPCFCLAHFLKSSSTAQKKYHIAAKSRILIMLSFAFLSFVAIFRVFAVLGSPIEIMKNYLKNFEPYLLHPTSYPKIQMLVFFFYFTPFYLVAITCLFKKQFGAGVRNWSVVFAGATAQAQFSHIGSSLKTVSYYWPPLSYVNVAFWGINLVQVISPHLFMFYCLRSPDISSNLKKKKVPTATLR